MSTHNQMLDSPLHDTEAEAWVIGSILLKGDLIDEVDLTSDDFYNSTNAAIFAEMIALRSQGKPIHVEILRKHLRNDDWEARAAEIAISVPVASHVDHYAAIVREMATRRALRDIAEQTADDAQNRGIEPEAILEKVETAASAIRLWGNRTDPVTIHDATTQAATDIDRMASNENAAGVLTGLYDFDLDQGGFHCGELIILAARPGLGKTSLGMQIAAYVASKQRLVYYASLEMSASELSTRLACSTSGVSSRRIRTGRLTDQDREKLIGAMSEQARSTLTIHDAPGLTVAEIRRQVRRLKRHGLELVVIDYLQLLTPADRRIPREQQVATMTKQLKELAREFDIPVLLLCQLNRQADGCEQPQLSHLRESGSIEQDADVVLFLAPHKPSPGAQNNASLIIAKNRNGETGPIPLNWIASETRFTCTPIAEEWTL